MLNVEVKWRQCRLFASLRLFLQEFWLVWTFSLLLSCFTTKSLDRSPLAWFQTRSERNVQTGKEKQNIWGRWLKNLFGKILIGTISAVRPGSDLKTPLFSRSGGVGTIHAISNLPQGHSSLHPTDFFGHFSENWFSFFYCYQRNSGRFFPWHTGPEFGLFWLPISIPESMEICLTQCLSFWGVHIVYQPTAQPIFIFRICVFKQTCLSQ